MRPEERRMRASLRRVEGMRDAETVAAMARLREAADAEPDPEACVLRIAHSSLLAAEDVSKSGETWTWAMAVNLLLDGFDRMAANTAE